MASQPSSDLAQVRGYFENFGAYQAPENSSLQLFSIHDKAASIAALSRDAQEKPQLEWHVEAGESIGSVESCPGNVVKAESAFIHDPSDFAHADLCCVGNFKCRSS